jgi:hypothetical protein
MRATFMSALLANYDNEYNVRKYVSHNALSISLLSSLMTSLTDSCRRVPNV